MKHLINTMILVALIGITFPVSAAKSHLNYIRIGDDVLTIPTIEVFQAAFSDGTLKYTRLKAGNFLSPGVHMGVKIEAQCKWYARLGHASLKNEIGFEGAITNGEHHHVINFTQGNRTLGPRNETLSVPTDFFEPLLEYGNERVAARANGSIFAENSIRSQNWTAYLKVPISFGVNCNNPIVGSFDDRITTATYDKTVRVFYRPISAELDLTLPAPGDNSPFNPYSHGELGDIVNVTANLLDVTNGESKECHLDLSATFTANGKTTIYYYLVDDRGAISELFRVPVDQDLPGFVFHSIDLSGREPIAPEPSSDLGFSAIPTDLLQGFYQIEVVSPHDTVSNIVSFNIEPCMTRPAVIKTIVGNQPNSR